MKKKYKNPLDLSEMELTLDLDFSKEKFQLDKGIELLARDMTDYIFNDNENSLDKLNFFSIRKNENELLINYPAQMSKQLYIAPCKTQKKTCRSRKCVEDTLKEILGDGNRDVDISYRRNNFSVTIEYTYQDC